LTGYDNQVPVVYGLSLLDGAILKPAVTLARPGGSDLAVDGFAVHPNGNFLANNGGTSCIYSQYNPTNGDFIGNTINVPGGPAQCTGVDTDGTSLYFVTDFNSITRTDLDGNMTGFSYFSGGDDIFVEDISLIHPVTHITNVDPAKLYLGLVDSDDINTDFDVLVELFWNAKIIGTGLKRCVPSAGLAGTHLKASLPAFGVSVPMTLTENPLLVSGDVLSVRISTRIGTNDDVLETQCMPPTGSHRSAEGLRFFYDATDEPSQITITEAPKAPENQYFHSDGSTCSATGPVSSPVNFRTLNNIQSVTGPRCTDVGTVDFLGGNPYVVFGTWKLPPLN
jgi:hypothetical protein